MEQHIRDIEELKGKLSKKLIKIVEVGNIKCDNDFNPVIQTKIEYNPEAIADYKRIFGEDSLYYEIGRQLFDY